MKIYHYLHESAKGTVEGKRISSSTISCALPGGKDEYIFNVDERDQRTLIVFDGELLFGGLPKNAEVVLSVPLDYISCSNDSVRNYPNYPCEATPEYKTESAETKIEIFRHFVLLPSCSAVVRKFRNRSLSPVYVIVSVFSGKRGPVVEWRTTSF